MKSYNQLNTGTVLAKRYFIEKIIGHGKSSTVYKALDKQTDLPVALKILDPFLAQDPIHNERFLREVKIINQIGNQNIINIYDYVEDNELKIIVMEFLEGCDLKDYIKNHGTFELKEFTIFAKNLMNTMSACHKKNIIHRDIKPQNIFILQNKQMKLLDFGISRVNTMSDLTKTGTAIGTPEYMSPEAFSSTQLDIRSDIYSAGVVLYEMLAGRPPYIGTSLAQVMAKQLKEDYPKLDEFRDDIPEWMMYIIYKCLKISPDQRYQSSHEVLIDFEDGEGAFINFSKDNHVRKCTKCNAQLIDGLSFCHSCGRMLSEFYKKGKISIILSRCKESKELADYLHKLFPHVKHRYIEKKIKKMPSLLFKKVDEETANTLFHELKGLPLEIKKVTRVSTTMELPRYLNVIMIITGYFLLGEMIEHEWAMLGVYFTIACFILIFSVYLKRTTPAVSLKPFYNKAKKIDPSTAEVANNISQLSDIKIKAMLGKIFSKRDYLKTKDAEMEIEVLDSKIQELINKGTQYSKWFDYLESTSINDIKRKMEIVDIKAKEAKTTDETQVLIKQKASLLDEFKHYRRLQEQYAEYNFSLLNFYELLNTMANKRMNWKEVELEINERALLEQNSSDGFLKVA
ncbi:MAG: serine/threonine protein kinase [Halobacteriovoraceae bacterium]|jgi:eukaryotic-like serine/threonine-protein kinase|nr:serine/threonine protein kinase [Halobacteriovoraceae bacterium]